MQFPDNRTALVTGATGYVAGWIVRRLLEEGFRVHAAVRDPSNAAKRRSLDALAEKLPGTIEYFRADLLEPGSYGDAMLGCPVVFHTASPFVVTVDDPQRELVDPARLGTREVLEQATATPEVERIVVTSSCAAIYGDAADIRQTEDGVFTEAHWNTTSSLRHQPYSYSKVMAEREAWAIAEAQDRWRLVTVNPSFVLGPAVNPGASGESFAVMAQIMDGTLRAGVPDFRIGVVDVRDVAEAHLRAAFEPAARGRYLTSGYDSSFPEMASVLRTHFGEAYPIPKRILPKWLVWLAGPLVDKRMTRRAIRRNIGHPWRGDHAKAVRELGMTWRPLETTLVDMVRQMIDSGRLPA
jgi:nucleoside-diphosphate-sugar epimerase